MSDSMDLLDAMADELPEGDELEQVRSWVMWAWDCPFCEYDHQADIEPDRLEHCDQCGAAFEVLPS